MLEAQRHFRATRSRTAVVPASKPPIRQNRVVAATAMVAVLFSLGLARHSGAIEGQNLFGLWSPAGGASTLSDEEQIREVIARYSRAVDTHDVATFGDLFMQDATLKMLLRKADGKLVNISDPIRSIDQIKLGFQKFSSAETSYRTHHFTHDPIMEISGDTAHINVQYLVTHSEVVSPEEAAGRTVQGKVTASLTGYYDDILKKVNGRWRISLHRIIFDLPYAVR